jgi:DNA-binding MarR family transcriptional regulator
MTLEQTIRIVQVAYPQVYLACHTRHQRKRTTEHRLSARDSAILAHLDERLPVAPARLAAHLGIARSTLSEAVKRLMAFGYTQRTPRPAARGRRGGIGLLLTAKGVSAMRATSVLEAPRLRTLLHRLTVAERGAVERGMTALAAACGRRTAGRDTPAIDDL